MLYFCHYDFCTGTLHVSYVCLFRNFGHHEVCACSLAAPLTPYIDHCLKWVYPVLAIIYILRCIATIYIFVKMSNVKIVFIYKYLSIKFHSFRRCIYFILDYFGVSLDTNGLCYRVTSWCGVSSCFS